MGCRRALSLALSEKSDEERVSFGGFSLRVSKILDLTHPLQAILEGRGGVSHGRRGALAVGWRCVMMGFTVDRRGMFPRETWGETSIEIIAESSEEGG